MARRRTRGQNRGAHGKEQRPLRFEQQLVLYQWLLNLLGVSGFDRLTAKLKAPEYEGLDENNVSHFYHKLKLLSNRPERPHDLLLPHDLLFTYDQNIVRHWRQITARRNHARSFLYPKYFQYLALLFAEIYLDRYFRDLNRLLAQLNAHVDAFNRGKYPVPGWPGGPVPEPSRIEPYTKQDLNKVAFWMATGSGKTLLMHINILQYKHHLNLHGSRQVNRVILLTPNEGLSHQHLKEFQFSGIDAELFSKEGRGLFTGRAVEILDVHKLRDEMGEKTVSVDAFEGNNLVLVDEGHRGTSGTEIGAWMQKRSQLCENGFSFEYSATFGQAVKASGNCSLEQVYAKCILLDYSYKYFYSDGYGKDYRILNLADDSDENVRRQYMTACLITFYQQLKLYREKIGTFRPFLLERPLWVFVGGSVNAIRTQSRHKVSDVVDILLFLDSFVQGRHESVASIKRLLEGPSGLLDAQGREIFQGTYQPLNTLFSDLDKIPSSADRIFDDILRVLFNAHTAASLHVENLKDTDGEVALRLGNNNAAFGMINVGDASALCKLCNEQTDLVVTKKEFSGSLFHTLNDEASTINLLIGSKKFTEGWSSWRVSTMGLMNIGRSEGPQIIQLFGRGVRLKGKDFSLKRSRELEEPATPNNIETLETLNIFGIRADYMRQFKEYLENEDLPTDEAGAEFVLPVIKNLGGKKLKMVRLQEGIDFKKDGPKPALGEPPKYLLRHPVVVDWYPKLQAMASGAGRTNRRAAKRDHYFFEERHLAFLDFDSIYFELQQFKNERAWHNLNLARGNLAPLFRRTDWYTLFIPKEEMHFRSFQQVLRWQEIAVALLKKYLDRYYKFRKQEYESGHLEYQELSEDDPNFISGYRLLIERSLEGIIQKLKEIKGLVETGKLQNVEFQHLHAIAFSHHLYEPLLYVDRDLIEVKPVVLENKGERDFVLDLQAFCKDKKKFLKGKELYLLRNMSRGRGIGFFEAGNFYPDFILWLLTGDRQFVSFIDPKGLRGLEGLKDPKACFHLTIKDLERKLGDPTIVLNSFIVSNTRESDVPWWAKKMTKEELEARNIFFQREDVYIKKLLDKVTGGG